ncbi:hypothetical protein [Bradyrhizobium sp. LeoA1S1]
MRVEMPGIMTEFPKVAHGDLFMTFVDKTQVFGMRIKLDNSNAVVHLNGGQPKVVDEVHFVNRDVFVLKDIWFRFSELSTAKGGNPDTYAYGSAILSAQGTFIRAAHANGPYDVEIGSGSVQLSRNHPGSFWFDSWEVVLSRPAKPDVLFAHHRTTTSHAELRM